jgi:DNA-binding transcriptional regulator YhcF (GntR family)
MEIQIDIDGEAPLFTQVMEQIKQAVSSGALAAGDPLPSIRQLANDLDINNKTVAKAYKLLERDNVIQTKGYRGTFIHPAAIENCTTDLNLWITTELTKAVSAFRHANATDSEIRIAFADVMNTNALKGN